MNNCPCCADKLLRHVRNQDIYWFCLRCRQEMPNFNLIQMEMVAIKNENNQYYDKSQIKSLITACPSKICPKYRSGYIEDLAEEKSFGMTVEIKKVSQVI